MNPGTQLGSYEILSPLGKGGMGEVWRARDQKLGREVAIKTLPEEFAQDEERLARFEREAKLLASLNHPNIATIHGLEEDNGTRFLVLELVEGDTLAERLKRGAIPVEESLKLALQIAEALEAAHEKGVIHRDLKPANIKVTPDGKVKVLDFGLAKAFAGDGADASVSQSPTLSLAATQQGVILGTAAYMSPEQARGQEVDKRADVWAFGVVLFEMLTGRGTFDGGTVSDVLAGVLRADPDWKGLPPHLHPRIQFLLERCLEKEAKDRYGDISDARVDIQKVLADPDGVIVQPVADESQTPPQSKLALLLGAFLLGALLTFIATVNFGPEVPDNAVRRYEIQPPVDALLGGRAAGNYLALSPDGNTLVYMASEKTGSGGQAYIHRLDSFESVVLEGTEGLAHPFFSPDGRWIGFFADGQLKRTSVDGGPTLKIADLDSPSRGATWLPDDTIVFGQVVGGLMRVAASEGDPEPLTTLTGDETAHRWPEVLPDGSAILYTSVRGDFDLAGMRIAVTDLESNRGRIVLDEAGANPRYAGTGHLLFTRENVLMAVPFIVEDLSVGERFPEPILEGISVRDRGAADFTISVDGSLAYMESTALGTGGRSELRIVGVDGTEELFVTGLQGTRRFGLIRVSPTADQVAVEIIDDNERNVWFYDLASATPTQFTFDGRSGFPVWSPDGEWIAFATVKDDGTSTISRMRVDGSGEAEPILDDGRRTFPQSWSTTSDHLAIGVGGDIEVLSLGEGTTEILTANDGVAETNPRFSPDGNWIAYQSNESGQFEIYVRPHGRPGNQTLVSTSGGVDPVWSPDGETLFFRAETLFLTMMAAAVETEPTFRRRNIEVQFGANFRPGAADVYPDQLQFMLVDTGGRYLPEQNHVNIILNFFEELKERVPVP